MSRGHWNNGKLDHQQAVRPLSSNPGPLLLRQRAPWPPVQRMAGPRSATAVPLVSPGVYRPAAPAKSGLGQRKYNSCRRRSKRLGSLLNKCTAIVCLFEAPPPSLVFLGWAEIVKVSSMHLAPLLQIFGALYRLHPPTPM